MSSSMPILTSDILLDDGKMMRNVLLFNNEIKEFDPMIAYLDGDYYYIYRGDLPNAVSGDHLDPGIYYDKQSDKYVLAVPATDEEKQHPQGQFLSYFQKSGLRTPFRSNQ